MSEFRRASHARVNVFEVDGTYLFKHYFEGEAVFDRLKPYYDNQAYRFEVPPDEFPGLRTFLADNGYGLVVVDAVDEFAVVVRQYTAHPDNIFKESVVQRRVGDYNCFLMTDQEAVEAAVDDGATRLTATGLENPFG
ncbi:MAG: hypothetical protein ACOC0F_01015 [archaeon]